MPEIERMFEKGEINCLYRDIEGNLRMKENDLCYHHVGDVVCGYPIVSNHTNIGKKIINYLIKTGYVNEDLSPQPFKMLAGIKNLEVYDEDIDGDEKIYVLSYHYNDDLKISKEEVATITKTFILDRYTSHNIEVSFLEIK